MAIVVLLLLEVSLLRDVTSLLAFLPLSARVLVTTCLLAPLGFFMYGFAIALISAAMVYLLAFGLFSMRSQWQTAE